MNAYIKPIVLLLMLLGMRYAGAQDLGIRGPIYPIKEPDLLKEIMATLVAKQQSGELARLTEQMKARAIRSITNPSPVSALTKTVNAATRYYDPTVEVGEDIRDPGGRLIVAAGTRKNPLDVVSMTRQLLFFDGRDASQVAFAKRIVDKLGGGVKPILVGGSYLTLMKDWQSAVFYDQQGALTSRLGILHVPAIVKQEGKQLRIDEVVVP